MTKTKSQAITKVLILEEAKVLSFYKESEQVYKGNRNWFNILIVQFSAILYAILMYYYVYFIMENNPNFVLNIAVALSWIPAAFFYFWSVNISLKRKFLYAEDKGLRKVTTYWDISSLGYLYKKDIQSIERNNKIVTIIFFEWGSQDPQKWIIKNNSIRNSINLESNLKSWLAT